MNTSDSFTAICHSLLREELSAIETYTQAIDKFEDNSGDSVLERIREDHEVSSEALRDLIGKSGGDDVTSSGPWGTFAKSVAGLASLFGESPALAILQQGELHGIAEYEKALDDNNLNESLRWLIGDELLPALRDHLIDLDRCKSMII